MSEEKMFPVKAEISVTLTIQDIDDIMASALDGGISYWCSEAEVVGEYLGEFASDQISRGGSLKLYDAEDGGVYELTLEKFLNGFKLWIENGGDRYGAIEYGKVDCCNIDAGCADAIIQYSIFGEIVYG